MVRVVQKFSFSIYVKFKLFGFSTYMKFEFVWTCADLIVNIKASSLVQIASSIDTACKLENSTSRSTDFIVDTRASAHFLATFPTYTKNRLEVIDVKHAYINFDPILHKILYPYKVHAQFWELEYPPTQKSVPPIQIIAYTSENYTHIY